MEVEKSEKTIGVEEIWEIEGKDQSMAIQIGERRMLQLTKE